MTTHFIETEVLFNYVWMGVVARSADMWGAYEFSFGGIAPGMVRAAYCAFDGFSFGD